MSTDKEHTCCRTEHCERLRSTEVGLLRAQGERRHLHRKDLSKACLQGKPSHLLLLLLLSTCTEDSQSECKLHRPRQRTSRVSLAREGKGIRRIRLQNTNASP